MRLAAHTLKNLETIFMAAPDNMPSAIDQPLTQQGLLKAAETATGLSNWNNHSNFLIGLNALIDATEAMDPTPEFRANVHNRIVQLLITKLQMINDEIQHPEILEQEIKNPLIVVGLPRTGTTILYDLLSLDPASRSPREWETFAPWPAPEQATFNSDPRIDMINAIYKKMLDASPELADIQRLDSTRPGECNHIMTHHFASTNFSAELAVPAYQDWFINTTVPGQYASHKRVLQQLQWKGPKGNWLLKSPVHLFDLENLLKTYPDAQLVWTHRDPTLTISSISSMVHALIKANGANIPKDIIGAGQWELWRAGLSKGTQSRRDNPDIENAVLDIAHRDVVNDPVAAVRKVYEHFGRDFSEQHATLISDFIANHPAASRIGKHKHSPEEYGLNAEKIRENLGDYYSQYGQYCAKP
jgi:hypothetical protein